MINSYIGWQKNSPTEKLPLSALVKNDVGLQIEKLPNKTLSLN